jgi:hypothetical protein
MLGFVYYHVGLLEEGLTKAPGPPDQPRFCICAKANRITLLYWVDDEALTELMKVRQGQPLIVPTQIAITLFI